MNGGTAHTFTVRVEEDGAILLRDLPVAAGQRVEITVVVLPQEPKVPADPRYPLRGLPYQFDDPHTPAVPAGDWNLDS